MGEGPSTDTLRMRSGSPYAVLSVCKAKMKQAHEEGRATVADIVHARLDFTMPEAQNPSSLSTAITRALNDLPKDMRSSLRECEILPNPFQHGVRFDLTIVIPSQRQRDAEAYIDEIVTLLLERAGIELLDEEEEVSVSPGSRYDAHVSSGVAEFSYA